MGCVPCFAETAGRAGKNRQADAAGFSQTRRRGNPPGTLRRAIGPLRSPYSITFIERNIVYADRNSRPGKNGRQYGAETFARRPRLRGFRYVGEGGGGTGSRESDRRG